FLFVLSVFPQVTQENLLTDPVWSVRDQPAEQLSDQRSRDTQDSELSLSLLCYIDAQESVCDGHGSVDQTSTESVGSDCNAGEQHTPLKTCSVKLVDCRNSKETREEATAEEEQSDVDDDDDDDDDFVPLERDLTQQVKGQEFN
ncbi:hypothetical protein cypCar_00044466, partial [Cyprinus carpio]